MIDVIMPCWIVNDELLKLTEEAIISFGFDQVINLSVNLIIIDNGSTMGGGLLRNYARTYIRNRENLGYAKAVNQGLKLSKNEFKAIANNDIRVSPNWQEVVHEVFSKDDKIYSCHFRMTDYDVPFAYGNTIAITGKERWCTSSFFVIKSWKPQLYDEHFLNSYDDWDYHLRTRNSGWKQAYTDKACYQHHHSFTQKLIPKRELNDFNNREYFKQKHYGYPEDLFAKEFPDQMNVSYQEGFNT